MAAAYIVLEDMKKGDVVCLGAGEINGVGITGMRKITKDEKKQLMSDLNAQNASNEKFMRLVEQGSEIQIVSGNKKIIDIIKGK
jgi:hypothetical protein